MAHPAAVSGLKIIFIILGALYATILLTGIIQLIRIHKIRKFPLKRWSTQKTFLVLLSVTCSIRTAFFFIVTFTDNATFDLGKFNIEAFTVIDDFGCVTFFTTYCLLLLFWIEIVYHSRNKTRIYRSRVRPTFFFAIILIYLIQVAIWIMIYVVPNRDLVDKIDNTYYSILSLFGGFGFLYYGIKLSLKLRRNPINSPGKKRKLIEVILFTLLCTICFIARSAIFLFISYYRDLNVNFINVFMYYGITEILPSIFVLWLFRKMPPRPSVVHESFRVEEQEDEPILGGKVNDIESSKAPLINNNNNKKSKKNQKQKEQKNTNIQ